MLHCISPLMCHVQTLWGERRGRGTFGAVQRLRMELPHVAPTLSFLREQVLTALVQDNNTIIPKWVVAALVPGLERQPLKRLNADISLATTTGSPQHQGRQNQNGLHAQLLYRFILPSYQWAARTAPAFFRPLHVSCSHPERLTMAKLKQG